MNADREESPTTRKRPSPAAEDESEQRRSGSSSSGPPASKRPRTASPDADPYAFPDIDDDDDNDHVGKTTKITKPVRADPLVPAAVAGPLAVPRDLQSPGAAKPDVLMPDPPRDDADAGAKPDALAVATHIDDTTKDDRGDVGADGDGGADDVDMVDMVMGGTDERERPSKGEKMPPGQHPPGHEHVGLKKPPPLATAHAKQETPDEKQLQQGQQQPPSPPPPPPPPPQLKLHEPQRLKKLRALHDQQREEEAQRSRPPKMLSPHEQARAGLRRALALALDHVGFASTTDEAFESFLLMTETYFQSLAEDVARFTLAARRTQPIPPDFECSLTRFNLGTGALRPHLRNPVPAAKRTPKYYDPWAAVGNDDFDLPLLADALSGQPEKDAQPHIPSGFPAFPSIHTYRHTPVDVDTVTVHGSGLRYEDGDGGGPVEAAAEPESAANGLPSFVDGRGRRDPKRLREAAAVEAKQAEAALRGLMRASKINKLKEVRAAAARNARTKQRYALWETAMRELVVAKGFGTETGAGGGAELETKEPVSATATATTPATAPAAASAAPPTGPTKNPQAALREEIADQSMMVNAEKVFHRKEEVARKAQKRIQQV
ncbi:bromodomain associated protein [Niveomyces insectorum RCEF 264]|uniref:Transcription initiation factor TFIID subunit 8 n=1 Tax=Niveomyces insectorum RCEF 264 TaxID=1081102 RepID=A0A167UVG3_9HYPO|nr:bromodomain associated protein [Niveomyces insectorum RCEF 264]